LKIGVISKPTYDHLLGKTVEIIAGAYIGLTGEVSTIDNDQEKVVVNIDLFGRATPTELAFQQGLQLSSGWPFGQQ
jgi:transcription termination/antitermination protein NusG